MTGTVGPLSKTSNLSDPALGSKALLATACGRHTAKVDWRMMGGQRQREADVNPHNHSSSTKLKAVQDQNYLVECFHLLTKLHPTLLDPPI